MISTFADMETLENTTSQEQTTETKPRNPNWGGRREGAGRKPKKPERRGGKREGAGRKPFMENPKSKNITLPITEDTRRKCDLLKERGFKLSEQFARLVNDLCELMGIE